MVGAYADWDGHVIVCGLPGVGLRIVEQLKLSGVPAVVIDDNPDPALAPLIETRHVPMISGSTGAAETLMSAGLPGAIAVICAQHDDLRTLQTALLVRRLRADVRVVAQITNPAVGRAVKEAGVSVLDVPGLSAPSVVEACLREGVQEMTLAGERFLAARTTAPRDATLRELYGALAPIAIVAAADGDVSFCPARDTKVREGDEVTLVGTPAELRAAAVFHYSERTRPSLLPQALPAAGRHARRGGLIGGLRDLSVSLARAADRKLALALGALVAVLIAASVVLRLTYQLAGPGHHISLLDAAYFTVETVTTVGYGDYSFRGEPGWLIVFAIALMMTGALFVAVFFALVTNTIVSRRIEEYLGRQKLTGLRDHVLVIGLGNVGLRVVRELHDAGSDVAVVEKDEDNRHLGLLRTLGVRVVIADGTLPEVLHSAQLATAAAVAVLTSDDLANLETGLAVRDQLGDRWGTIPVVLRIFDEALARSIKETFGFTSVRSTAALAAPWFVGAALGLDVLSTFYAGDEPLLVASLTVTPDGGLAGVQMKELGARIRVLAITRAADGAVLEHPPRGTTRFRDHDEAYLIGPYSELLTVLRRDRQSERA